MLNSIIDNFVNNNGIDMNNVMNTAKKAFSTLGCLAGIAGCLILSVLNLLVFMLLGQYELVSFFVSFMQIVYYIGIFGFIRKIFNKSFFWVPNCIKPILHFIFKPVTLIARKFSKPAVEDCWVDVNGRAHRVN